MVYSSALVFGHLLSEEENVVEMTGKCFCPLKTTGQKMSSSRRGSVESYEESESISSCKLFVKLVGVFLSIYPSIQFLKKGEGSSLSAPGLRTPGLRTALSLAGRAFKHS